MRTQHLQEKMEFPERKKNCIYSRLTLTWKRGFEQASKQKVMLPVKFRVPKGAHRTKGYSTQNFLKTRKYSSRFLFLVKFSLWSQIASHGPFARAPSLNSYTFNDSS